MDEERLDSFMRWRPFGTIDAIRIEAQARRSAALGIALWGKSSEELHRQLLAPHPEIPAGFDLTDFRELERSLRRIATSLGDPRYLWLSNTSTVRALFSPTMTVGPERLSAWEARCEIIRRAIEYLEGR